MPITPLHFGLLAPINHFAPKKVSNVSFILVSLWMDGNSILSWVFNLPMPEHTWESHSLLAALIMAGLVSLGGVLVPSGITRKWILGAFIGGISHTMLDSLVHSEMSPLFPLKGNLFYFGWMEPVSMAMLPLTIWFIFQFVSGSLGYVRRFREAAPEHSQGPSS